MKKIFLLLLFAGSVTFAKAQSGAMHIADDMVYQNTKDGETIGFYINGDVRIKGKLDHRFTFTVYDGCILLSFNGKRINQLCWSYDCNCNCVCLTDKRGEHYKG